LEREVRGKESGREERGWRGAKGDGRGEGEREMVGVERREEKGERGEVNWIEEMGEGKEG
jgi:hypothetical protein